MQESTSDCGGCRFAESIAAENWDELEGGRIGACCGYADNETEMKGTVPVLPEADEFGGKNYAVLDEAAQEKRGAEFVETEIAESLAAETWDEFESGACCGCAGNETQQEGKGRGCFCGWRIASCYGVCN